MPGTRNKITVLLLIVTMALSAFTSCGDSKWTDGKAAPGTIVSETETEICIVDQAGREVTVGKYPNSIALCYRVVVRFLLSLDLGDRITGMGKNEQFFEDIQPSLKDCADVGQGVADIEALAELKPDLFIHKSTDVETLEAVEKIGIPALGINVETPDDMMTALKIIGAVCDKSEKAEMLIEYYDKELDSIDELTKNITERSTAVVMGSSIGKVADGSMLQGAMIEYAGGINCAADIDAGEIWPTAGTEQIFLWDPEYIFISNSQGATYTVDDILSDSAWSEIKAVKNKNVYLMPAEMDSWEFPGVVSLLGIEYMMNKMYPDIISEAELENKVDELYTLMYGKKLGREYLGY